MLNNYLTTGRIRIPIHCTKAGRSVCTIHRSGNVPKRQEISYLCKNCLKPEPASLSVSVKHVSNSMVWEDHPSNGCEPEDLGVALHTASRASSRECSSPNTHPQR